MSGIVYEELLAYVREQLAADRAAQDAADDADVIAGRAVYIAGGTVKPDYRVAKLIAQHEDDLEPLRKVLVEMTGNSAFAKYKPVDRRRHARTMRATSQSNASTCLPVSLIAFERSSSGRPAEKTCRSNCLFISPSMP